MSDASGLALYEMVAGDTSVWLSLRDAAARYDSGWERVTFGRWVIDAPGATPRAMTDADRRVVSAAADRFSEDK